MEPIEWSPMDAAKFGVEKLKADPMGLILPLFVASLAIMTPMIVFSMIGGVIGGIAEVPLLGALGQLFGIMVMMLASSYVSGGTIVFLLKVMRGQEYALGDVFSGGRFFIPLVIHSFIMGFVVGLGMLLCYVPGIILALGLGQSAILVVDKGLSPVDALKESWRITTGHKLNLFIFGIIGGFIIMLGEMACFIGIFAAIPVVAVAQMYIYERLSGAAAPGAAAPPGPTTF